VAHNTWLQPGPTCAPLQVKVAPQLPGDAGGQSSGRGVAPFAGQNLMLPSINRAGAPDRACRVTQTIGLPFPQAGLTLPMMMSACDVPRSGGVVLSLSKRLPDPFCSVPSRGDGWRLDARIGLSNSQVALVHGILNH
jgi:hypothetical protein